MVKNLVTLFLLNTISHASFGSVQNMGEKNQRLSNGIGWYLWSKLFSMVLEEKKM